MGTRPPRFRYMSVGERFRRLGCLCLWLVTRYGLRM